MPEFKIGDTAWIALYGSKERYVKCPDCLGLKSLKVIIGDGTEYNIPCTTCSPGFEGATGFVKTWEFEAETRTITITGVSVALEGDKRTVEYRFGNSHLTSDNVFATREEAMHRAMQRAKEREEQEARTMQSKTQVHRSWAWHVTYHRQCLKRALNDVKFHTAKLNVAKEHAKETEE